MSYDYEDVDRPGNRPTGASIPLETSLAAWKSIAEERLAAVEMWKQKTAQAAAEIERLRTILTGEPTEAMMDAGEKLCMADCHLGGQMREIWKAMAAHAYQQTGTEPK